MAKKGKKAQEPSEEVVKGTGASDSFEESSNSGLVQDNVEETFSLESAPQAEGGVEHAEEEGTVMAEASAEEDQLGQLWSDYYLEYASYVVKDRAIPDVDDGMKPVQRRIMHCLNQIDDGRFNRVASVVGDAMHYHPHGDASIAGALTVLANKEYFIDRQGNFGNILTGDSAAAPRYIECRLTQLARETMFNKELTEFVDSYDGRSEEPVRLPAKVPALLMLGAEGIAVGMATDIFPHNFNELLDAQVAILENREFQVYPDFLQGGIMDVSEYEDGAGRIRLRARIEPEGDKKVIIREIPASTTTEGLLESIEKAAKQGKIKIQSINDYTTDKVAIEIVLARGVYAEDTIRELYAYTDCEVSLKSTLRVICEDVPMVMTVSDVLRRNTSKLVEYLRMELELARQRLENLFHDKTLAQIFIENRIYKRIEKCETMERIMKETRKGVEEYRHLLHRDISDEDIEKLLQIPIRRISLFDIKKNETELAKIISDIADIDAKLGRMVEVAIEYIRGLQATYGSLFPRRTEIAGFDVVKARDIARKDVKVYHDRQNHFLGTNVRSSSKEGAPLVCTAFDKLVLLRGDGSCRIIPVCEKEYIGPTRYVMLADKNQVYSILYFDKVSTTWYAKRFTLGQYTAGKEYHIIPPDCIIKELYTNVGVVVELKLKQNNRRSYNAVTVDFSQPLYMRSREARGIKVTGYQVDDIEVIKRGVKPEKLLAEASSEESGDMVGAEEAPFVPEGEVGAGAGDGAGGDGEVPHGGEAQPPGGDEQAPDTPVTKLKRRIDENSIFTLE